jgi:hypothetical protein
MPKLGLGLSLPQTRITGSAPLIPTDGLSLWLKADAGVTIGSVGGVTYATGKISNCASFDGQDGGGSYNSRLYSDSFGVDVNNNFSFSVWMKPRSFSSYQHIIGAPFNNGFYIGADETDLKFSLFNGAVFGITAPTVTPDTWHHYVFIRDGDTLKLYADNSLIGTADVTGETFTGDPLFSVGGGENSEYFFNGDIDEMALWSRVLSGSEVSTIYNSGNGINYAAITKTNLISYWSLDETSGTRMDSHGSNDLLESPSSEQGVTQWADQSGNDRNFSINSETLPNFVTISEKSFVNFNSNENLVRNPGIWFGQPYEGTIFIVARFPSSSSSAGARLFYHEDDFAIVRGAASTNVFYIQNGGDAGIDAVVSDTNVNNNTNYIIESTFSGTSASIYLNGAAVGTGNIGEYGGGLNMFLGNVGGGDEASNTAEVVIYNRVLTTPERQQVEAYLMSKYAIEPPPSGINANDANALTIDFGYFEDAYYDKLSNTSWNHGFGEGESQTLTWNSVIANTWVLDVNNGEIRATNPSTNSQFIPTTGWVYTIGSGPAVTIANA